MKSKIIDRDNIRYRVKSKLVQSQLWLHVNGETWVIDQKPKRIKKNSSSASDSDENHVLSPMPGKVLRILAKKGERVEKNQVLVVMEAMKMEYSLQAPRAGEIETIDCQENDQVELGRQLVKIK